MSKDKEAYFKGLNQTERLTALKENAVTSYKKNVVRNFDEEELAEMKNQLSDVSINLNDTEIEKKEMTGEINGRIKIIKSQRQNLLRDLKNKYYESTEEVFDVDNQEEGMMYTYDNTGAVISSRRLTPSEKQISIKQFNSKAS